MVSFMEQHAATCEVCLQDPDLKDEIAKITELILPESKIPKAIRQQGGFDDDSTFEDDDGLIENGENDDNALDNEESNDIDDIDPEEEDEFLEDTDED